jgi:hypothetical protein
VAVLRQARLLENRKDGRWVYCRRAGRGAPPHVLAALRWLDSSTAGDEAFAADARRIEEITRIPVEELCRSTG